MPQFCSLFTTWRRPCPCGPAVACLAAVILALSAAACGEVQDAARPRATLRVAIAFAPLTNRLIEEYRRTLPDVDIQEQPPAGTGDTVALIQSDSADLGVALANDAYRAFVRDGGEGGSRIRGLSLLQPLPMYLLVRSGSGIHRVEDLSGRVVGVGPENTTSWTLIHLMLTAFKLEGVTVKTFASREPAAQGLKDGSLDAVGFPGYVYPDEATLAAIRDGAYLVPIEGPAVEALRRDSPFVRTVMIPRDIYPGQDRIIPTIGIDMVIICRRDLDPDLVYRLTEQLFNVFPRLARIEATLRFLNVDEAPATPIPLHPGAARYYRERELSR